MNMQSAIAKVRSDGVGTILRRKLRWYRDLLRVAATGNTVEMDGLTYSIAPFSTALKSTIAKGRHEEPERKLAQRWIPADVPVIEFGGGMGVVSCLANRKLLDPTQHVVVEANPAMVPLLEHNRDLNGCQFKIVNAALAYDASTLTLSLDPNFVGSSSADMPGASGTFEARATTAGAIMDEYGFERCGIICDIEGAEADLIEREFTVLGDCIRYISAEFHPYIIGEERYASILGLLTSLGFKERQSIGICGFWTR